MRRVASQHQIEPNLWIYQTNCMYSSDGQIIIVEFLPSGRALFNDISRGIYGITDGQVKTCEDVEQAYLYDRYSMDWPEGITFADLWAMEPVAQEWKHKVPCTR